MKIAVACETKDENSVISERAGRAPFYLIFSNGKLEEVLENPFAVGTGGAAYGVAKMLLDKGVKKVIAGNTGGNFQYAMQEKGIAVEIKNGKCAEALQ
ncbi:hypothetical protein KAW38_02210 [Candidatus Micrarchaeota archaeon]|nr:hypothetical protein [Candidatus Micrarchaeota archaeon]